MACFASRRNHPLGRSEILETEAAKVALDGFGLWDSYDKIKPLINIDWIYIYTVYIYTVYIYILIYRVSQYHQLSLIIYDIYIY